jgi:hypothetical protein
MPRRAVVFCFAGSAASSARGSIAAGRIDARPKAGATAIEAVDEVAVTGTTGRAWAI